MCAFNNKEIGKYEESLRQAEQALKGHIPFDLGWPYYRSYIENLITGHCPDSSFKESMLKLMSDLQKLLKIKS